MWLVDSLFKPFAIFRFLRISTLVLVAMLLIFALQIAFVLICNIPNQNNYPTTLLLDFADIDSMLTSHATSLLSKNLYKS